MEVGLFRILGGGMTTLGGSPAICEFSDKVTLCLWSIGIIYLGFLKFGEKFYFDLKKNKHRFQDTH